jgi:hypothetical protein
VLLILANAYKVSPLMHQHYRGGPVEVSTLAVAQFAEEFPAEEQIAALCDGTWHARCAEIFAKREEEAAEQHRINQEERVKSEIFALFERRLAVALELHSREGRR